MESLPCTGYNIWLSKSLCCNEHYCIQYCRGGFSPQVIPLLGPATDTVCYQLGWVGMNSFGFSVWFGISICGANSAKIQNRLRPFLNFVIQNYFLCRM